MVVRQDDCLGNFGSPQEAVSGLAGLRDVSLNCCTRFRAPPKEPLGKMHRTAGEVSQALLRAQRYTALAFPKSGNLGAESPGHLQPYPLDKQSAFLLRQKCFKHLTAASQALLAPNNPSLSETSYPCGIDNHHRPIASVYAGRRASGNNEEQRNCAEFSARRAQIYSCYHYGYLCNMLFLNSQSGGSYSAIGCHLSYRLFLSV